MLRRVGVRVVHPRIVDLGVKRRVNRSTISRNIINGCRMRGCNARRIDVDLLGTTTKCKCVLSSAPRGPLERYCRSAQG